MCCSTVVLTGGRALNVLLQHQSSSGADPNQPVTNRTVTSIRARFHGVHAPAAKWSSAVVPKLPFKLQLAFPLENGQTPGVVYDINAERCPECGCRGRPIGTVTDPHEAQRFLDSRETSWSGDRIFLLSYDDEVTFVFANGDGP